MSKGDLIEFEGEINSAMGGGWYSITLNEGGSNVRARVSGRMKNKHIRVLPGDKVRVAVSPYDLTHGMVVYRHR